MEILKKELDTLYKSVKMNKSDMTKWTNKVNVMIDEINKHLKDKRFNAVTKLYQGSFQYDTVLIPEDGKLSDVDAGLHCEDCEEFNSKNPGALKDRIFDALKNIGQKPKMKNMCIEIIDGEINIDFPIYITCGSKEMLITGTQEKNLVKSNARGVNEYVMPSEQSKRDKIKIAIVLAKFWAVKNMESGNKIPSLAFHMAAVETYNESDGILVRLTKIIDKIIKQINIGEYKLPKNLDVFNNDVYSKFTQSTFAQAKRHATNFLVALTEASKTDSNHRAYELLKKYLPGLEKPKAENGTGNKPGNATGGR